jgi:hypothetical protein
MMEYHQGETVWRYRWQMALPQHANAWRYLLLKEFLQHENVMRYRWRIGSHLDESV